MLLLNTWLIFVFKPTGTIINNFSYTISEKKNLSEIKDEGKKVRSGTLLGDKALVEQN